MASELFENLHASWLLRVAFGALGGVALSASAAAFASRAEMLKLRLDNLTLRVPGLPPGLDGLTIGHASDLHLGPWIDVDHVVEGLARLQAEKPDVIVLTGDFVNTPRPRQVALIEPVLSGLRAPLGVFAVLGNHDYFGGDHRLVRRALRRVGVDLLDNSHRCVDVGGAALYLAGVDDLRWGRPSVRRALAGVPRDAFTLLLAHEPDFADVAAAYPVAAQLSGHTHGGQVRLPGLHPRWAPYMGRRYIGGLYRVGQMWLYVNRGLGTGFPPIRINCPPEVGVVRLARGEDAS